jgi:hypothetical protein
MPGAGHRMGPNLPSLPARAGGAGTGGKKVHDPGGKRRRARPVRRDAVMIRGDVPVAKDRPRVTAERRRIGMGPGSGGRVRSAGPGRETGPRIWAKGMGRPFGAGLASVWHRSGIGLGPLCEGEGRPTDPSRAASWRRSGGRRALIPVEHHHIRRFGFAGGGVTRGRRRYRPWPGPKGAVAPRAPLGPERGEGRPDGPALALTRGRGQAVPAPSSASDITTSGVLDPPAVASGARAAEVSALTGTEGRRGAARPSAGSAVRGGRTGPLWRRPGGAVRRSRCPDPRRTSRHPASWTHLRCRRARGRRRCRPRPGPKGAFGAARAPRPGAR